MNRPLLKRVIPQVLAWTALVALSGAIALAQDAAPPAGVRTDGQIEMDVVHALDGSRALKGDLITAATIQSEVTLSGTVPNEAASELAESIAGRVAGVSAVHNNLKVGNPQEAATPGDSGARQMNEDQPDDAPVAATAPAPDGPLPPPGEAHDHHIPQAATPPLPGGRELYAPVPAPAPLPAPEGARSPVTVPQGTLLQLRTNEFLDSKHAKDGAQVEFTVIHDVVFGGVLAIPRGATAHGVVTETKQPGALTGSPELALKLTSIDLGGQSYDIQTDEFKVKGPGKGGQTAGNVFGGAILGAIIGGAAGGGPGAAIGAAAGGGAGTVASAASSGPRVWIPAEALVDFHLTAPATVTPVDRQEAARLAQGLNQGGPSLYRRGYAPYGRPYVAAYGYPYGYPYGYYRPYYIVGGYHYWR